MRVLRLACLLHLLVGASIAKSQITAEVMASPLSSKWVSAGHAFVCIAMQTNTGIKEECYGFYPANASNEVFVGAPALSDEFKKNPTRFSQISWSVKKSITVAQRQAFYALVNSVNVGSYQLLANNCGDFVSDAVNAFGWTNVSKGPLPEPYVRNLFAANIRRFEHSQGSFERSGSEWVERHSATTAVYRFRHVGNDDSWINARDDGRGMDLRLPLKGGFCQWRTTGSWNNLYSVSPRL